MGSVHRRHRLDEPPPAWLLDETKWPTLTVDNYLASLNAPMTSAEADSVRTSIVRGRPLGDAAWVERTAATLGLGSTLRPRGRPRKIPAFTDASERAGHEPRDGRSASHPAARTE